MNPKQTAPLLVTLAPLIAAAPPLIVGGVIGWGILCLLKAIFSDDEEAKLEVPSVEANTTARKPAETIVFRQIPAAIPAVKLASILVAPLPPAPVPPPIVLPLREESPLVPVEPFPSKRRMVGRQDMAAIFQNGGRTFCRTDAVAALKGLGFGKTAAYAALAPDGRFSAWLQCAPDGIITWTGGQGT